MRRSVILLSLLLQMLLARPAPASADPAYSVAERRLAAAVSCPVEMTSVDREPVLLVHGTATTTEDTWSASWLSDVPALGFDVCTVDLPDFALNDIQTAAEYVVYAIRAVSTRAGRPVDVVGHSQGGLEIRWALRWWRSLRPLVDDAVLLATPNHGASGADTLCPGACAPAVHQQKSTSRFLDAINSLDETPGDVDYTNVYTLFDELVQPVVPVATSATTGASNVLVQDLCPGRPVHHVGMVYDAVVFAVALDALVHDGAADVRRFDPATCAKATMDGVSAVDAVNSNTGVYANAYVAFAMYPPSEAEPPLKPYVCTTCA